MSQQPGSQQSIDHGDPGKCDQSFERIIREETFIVSRRPRRVTSVTWSGVRWRVIFTFRPRRHGALGVRSSSYTDINNTHTHTRYGARGEFPNPYTNSVTCLPTRVRHLSLDTYTRRSSAIILSVCPACVLVVFMDGDAPDPYVYTRPEYYNIISDTSRSSPTARGRAVLLLFYVRTRGGRERAVAFFRVRY